MVILITGDNLKANKQLAAILASSFAGDSFILTDLTVTPWLGASLDCIDWQTAESSQIILISTTADTQNPAFNPIHIDKHYFIVRCDGKNIYTVYQFDGFQPDFNNPARLVHTQQTRLYPANLIDVYRQRQDDDYYKRLKQGKTVALLVYVCSIAFAVYYAIKNHTVFNLFAFSFIVSTFAASSLVALGAFNRSVE